MTPDGFDAIRQAFPKSKWAFDTNKGYQEAFTLLKPFSDEEAASAIKNMRSTLGRNSITAEELQQEIRRLRRRSEVKAEAERSAIDEGEVERDRKDILRLLVLATREEIAAGVAYARSVQAITAEPLPSDVTEWSNFTRGIVWAAMEKQGVFQ